MALTRQFGALVQSLLSQIVKDGAPADGYYHDLCRRKLIDQLERLRSVNFGFNETVRTFPATAGV